MSKLTKQNVGGVDYTTVGCALNATCDSAASDYIKVATLTDGDVILDGMHVVCTFTNGNTAGTSPDILTIYSSDQVNYYSDAGLTQPFTLAPEGCYRITYTGTGNAYSYISWICLSVGGVTAIVTNPCAGEAGGTLWSAGNPVIFLYSGGRFRLLNVGLSRLDLYESWQSNPASVRAVVRNNKFAEFDYSGTSENPIDIYSIASSIPDSNFSKTISIRVIGSQTNSPYGAGVLDGDFHYDIKRISYNPNAEYIRIIAYDIRDNQIYENAKINGTWGNWTRLMNYSDVYTQGIGLTFNDTYVSDNIYACRRIGNLLFVNGILHLKANVPAATITDLFYLPNNITPTIDSGLFWNNDNFINCYGVLSAGRNGWVYSQAVLPAGAYMTFQTITRLT